MLRHNGNRKIDFIATMDLYVATLSKKSLKKNVATFPCFVVTLNQANGSREVSCQSNLCRDVKS